MITHSSCDYRNKNGEEYRIRITEARVPPEADYWGYFVVADHDSWGPLTFKAIVRKVDVDDKEAADKIAEGPVLDEVMCRLDEADAEGALRLEGLVHG